MKLKFLHKVGTGMFYWPERDDIDSSHISYIFFGPVNLRYNRPFKIEKEAVVEVFKFLMRKHKSRHTHL